MKPGGYIALYRSIFDNRTLDDVASRREAFAYLIAKASYLPTSIQEAGNAKVNVSRGQYATTLRTLAKQWRWPLTRVRRFITLLRQEKMISIEYIGGPLHIADTPTGTPKSVRCIVLSICNYSSFQIETRSKKSKLAHQPALKKQGKLPLVWVLRPEESNKSKDTEGEDSGKRKREARSTPKSVRHANNGSIFVPLDHPQYQEFADDFKTTTGFDPEPVDGGNWFWPIGEAQRPAKLLHLRARGGGRHG